MKKAKLQKKVNNLTNKVKKAQYEYFVSYVDKNNKFGSMIVDMNFLLNSTEAIKDFNIDLNNSLRGNFKCIINFVFLRRKYITVEVKNEGKTN